MKKQIVLEFYGTPNNINNTSRKYKVTRSCIIYWKKCIDDNGMASIEDQKKIFTLHKGRKVEHEALYAQLFQYFEQLRKSNWLSLQVCCASK